MVAGRTVVDRGKPVVPTSGYTNEPLSGGLIEGVGNTPLLELTEIPGLAPGARLFAKLESVNPGGSIKDRSVSRIIAAAVVAGHFRDGRRLLDSSSGNAGIAYAMFGAAAGIGVTLVIPANASTETRAVAVASI